MPRTTDGAVFPTDAAEDKLLSLVGACNPSLVFLDFVSKEYVSKGLVSPEMVTVDHVATVCQTALVPNVLSA